MATFDGLFDDLIPVAETPLRKRNTLSPADDPFADLLPEPEAVSPRLQGLSHAASPLLSSLEQQPPPASTSNYLGEFARGIGRGAADLGGTVLKGAAALQTAASRDMVRFAKRQIEVMDRIERGEAVPPADDVYSYAQMPPPERQATRKRLTARLTEFDLPGPATTRDLYTAGEFVSEAGRKAFPAGRGWEDSTTAALGQGVGSVVAGLPLAVVGPGTAAIAFGAAGSGEALERAAQDGATDDQQLKAALLGIAPGTTDVVPIEILMGRLRVPQPFRRPLAQAIGRIGSQALVEGLQEGGQKFLQNLIAREVYKPEQSLSEGVVPEGGLGAGVGGIVGTGREMIRLLAGGRRRPGAPQPPPIPEQPAAAVPQGNPFADLIPQQPATPDLALTRQGQSLTDAGTGEAARKFRRVDRSALELDAERLSRNVRAFEDELRASDAAPEQIAEGINQRFGFEATPDEIAAGNVWWRLDDAIAKETGRGPRGRFAGIALPPDAETAMRREWRNLSNLEISSRLQREFGLNVRREHVSEIRNRLGYPAKTRERDDVLPGEVEKALRSEEFSRLTHAEAQAELRDRFGLERSRHAVQMLRERRGLEAPSARVPTPLSPDAEAFLRLPEAAALSNEAAAAVLRARFGIDLSYKTIERRRRQLGLSDVDARLIWSPEEIAWVQRPETKGMSRKHLVEEFYQRFGRRVTEKAMESQRGKARAAMRARGETPDFALTADEISEQKAELARQWGLAVQGRLEEPGPLGDIWAGVRDVERSGPPLPINWESQSIRNLLEGRGRKPSSRGDFPWSPEALQMIRAAEGRQLFADLARDLSERFGRTVTRDMVASKVARLRAISHRRLPGEPMFAIGEPETWLARFRRRPDARSQDLQAPRGAVDERGRQPAARPPGTEAADPARARRAGPGGGRGRVARVDLGRFSGVAVETDNLAGLRQRRYFIYPKTSQLPSERATPSVTLRVLRSSSNWIAKAHVTETAPGQWEVLGVNVRRNRQRRGIAGELYDAIERELGVTLGPSPAMTRQLYRFWQKRDAKAVRNFQRIGERFYAPDMVRTLKAVNDDILERSSDPRERAQALKYQAAIDEALANVITPEAALKDDSTARQHVGAFLRMGRAVAVPQRVVDDVLAVLRGLEGSTPPNTRLGVLTKVEPLQGESADDTVISGNGRALSIAEAYRDPALRDRADAYRESVLAHADELGLGEEALAMREPVIISRIVDDLSDAELARFADLSNRPAVAAMSATERARRDARVAGPEIMGTYQGGAFTAPHNRAFYRAFTDKVVTPSERGALSKDGILTLEGETRLSAAVLAAAYDDATTLSRMLESADDNIRAISGAMRDAAGPFIALKEDIRNGVASPAFDITPQIAETARRISELRERGVKLSTFLDQQDAFQKPDPVVEGLLRAFYNSDLTRPLSRDKVTTLLTAYAEEARRHSESGLIPDETRPADIIRYAVKKARDGEAGLFDERPSPAGRTDAGPRPAPQGRPPGVSGPPPRPAPQQGQVAPPQALRTTRPPPLPLPPSVPPPGPAPAAGGGLPPPITPRRPPPLPGLGGPSAPPPMGQARRLLAWKTNLLELFHNSEERMRQLVDRVGQGRLPDDADPYLNAKLYHGRIGAKIRQGYDEARDILRDIQRLSTRTGETFEAVRATVNDYLIARHAPERNAQHGDGAAGITNAEAQHTLQRINARSDGAQIRAIANRAQALNERALDMLHDAGVISTQMFTKMRSVYPHHVPLNRVFADQPDFVGAMVGRGFDVYSSGIKRAKGSDLEVSDILGNIVLNYEQASLRSEKNLVDLSTLEFVRRHGTLLGGLMRARPPRIVGTRSDGSPLFEQTSDPRILHLFEDGKPVWIEVSDVRLAAAFRAINRQQLPQVLRWISAFTRLYSGLQTRFNPEFAAPNKLRDLQEAMVYLAADKNIRAKGALKTAVRDPASLKDVLDHLRGRNTPGAMLYQEMIDAGGTTGGMGLSTRAEVELNIGKLERLATSRPRRFAEGFVELVDAWNTIFEDSTRLSVYKTAREQGLSKKRAALHAKTSTIDFNQMGTAGPVVNALYMFSNASIQGSVKMVRSLKNPKVAIGVGVILAAAVAAVTEWNDEIDPDWRDKVSKWDRLNSMPIVLPNENGEGVRYVSVPVSWGLKPLYVMAAHPYDTAKGVGTSLDNMLSDFAVSILEAYNPAGGTDLMQAITPTPLDAPLDLSRNTAWHGGRIKPDFDADLPQDLQYFMRQKDTASGRGAIATSKALREYTGMTISPADLAYATEQYLGGAGRTAGKTVNTLIGIGTGEPPPLNEFPMLSRFYRERSQEQTGRGTARSPLLDDLSERREDQARERFDVRDRADDAKRRILALPERERLRAFDDLKRTDPDAAASLAQDVAKDDLDRTPVEQSMMKLGVENGERARYIVDQLQSLPKSQRTVYLSDLRKKKILTPDVHRQVRILMSGRDLRRRPQRVRPPASFRTSPDPFADLVPAQPAP